MATATTATSAHPGKWYQHLYVQVLAAIVLGVLLGHFYPSLGEAMKPLGDAFIKLIKMIIAPIIFFTVVHGIASMKDMKKVGRVGLKALIYFEVVTTLALIIGLIVVNVWQPGVGMNVDLSTVDTKSIATFTAKAKDQSTVEFLMDIIPSTVVGAFADGRDPAGAVLRHPVRLRAADARRAGRAGAAPHRRRQPRVLPHRRHHHEGGADRRLRRDGVHDRQVRRRHARCRSATSCCRFYTTCLLFIFLVLGRYRGVVRLLDPEVHPLHQGGAADRARHLVVGVGAAAHDRQDGEPRLPRSRSSGSSSRPATPSTSTAPAST